MCNAWIGFAALLVIKVVEPVGRIWDDEEEDGPEADALFTVIILGEELVGTVLVTMETLAVVALITYTGA